MTSWHDQNKDITPAVHGKLANIGASSFLPIIELNRYFASWCIYLLEQTFTPTHVCTYNMVWLCGRPNIVSPYIVPNSHPKLLSVTNIIHEIMDCSLCLDYGYVNLTFLTETEICDSCWWVKSLWSFSDATLTIFFSLFSLIAHNVLCSLWHTGGLRAKHKPSANDAR